MIVLDASVLIGHLDANDAHHARASRLLEAVSSEDLAASSLTLAETLVGPARAGRLEDASAALAELGVVEVPLGVGAARRLAQLRSATHLRLPDCCVLLAAQDAGAALASFDDRLVAAARELGVRVAAAT